ncbi:MAG: arginyltransferase [Planctomycetes bacterium]|nr:arginyltransferase [Planctomycetota bacterium]
MQSLYTFHSFPSACSYLPEETSRLAYEIVAEMSAEEYEDRLIVGWRRFGFTMFQPRCASCQACQSIRVPIATFRPNRSQRRAWNGNLDLRITVGDPCVTEEKLALYDRFHSFQADARGWPSHDPKQEASYQESFVDNPFPTQEWCYYLNDRLIGVGYVDRLPNAMSAIYFFHDPRERHRSLGTFNVLRIIAEAARVRIPYLYLGYYVQGCQSLEYKANFTPNEVIDANGDWVPFHV